MEGRVLEPWNAKALPEIMAEVVQDSNRRCVPEPHPDGQAAGQQPSSAAGARGGGAEKPSQGLMLRLTGVPKARPS